MGEGAPRARRNDPGLRAIAGDPDVMTAIEESLQAPSDHLGSIEEAIAATDDRTLKGWVAVAMWEDESGETSETVMTDGHSSSLEVKGYLHDAIWTSAHADS